MPVKTLPCRNYVADGNKTVLLYFEEIPDSAHNCEMPGICYEKLFLPDETIRVIPVIIFGKREEPED